MNCRIGRPGNVRVVCGWQTPTVFMPVVKTLIEGFVWHIMFVSVHDTPDLISFWGLLDKWRQPGGECSNFADKSFENCNGGHFYESGRGISGRHKMVGKVTSNIWPTSWQSQQEMALVRAWMLPSWQTVQPSKNISCRSESHARAST